MKEGKGEGLTRGIVDREEVDRLRKRFMKLDKVRTRRRPVVEGKQMTDWRIGQLWHNRERRVLVITTSVE